jgi:hypothetical protein
VSRDCVDRLRALYVPPVSEMQVSTRVRPGQNVPLLAECDVCGSADLAEVRCKVICRNCRTILQSCADL